jgi:hypothetical protein
MLTLLEASKLHDGNVLRQGVIEIYAQSSPVLEDIPFSTIQGNALKYNREDTLPGVGFRGVNEAYAESTGIINPLIEPLVIAGGDLDVDKFILDTMGMDQRATQESMKIKALALAFTAKFFKGDSNVDPREFDGLQVRITGSQLIPAGNTANGDAPSLLKLDEMIAKTVGDKKVLYMNLDLSLKLTAASRDTAIGGNVVWATDSFGRQIQKYNGIPIQVIRWDNNNVEILGFTEACPGGGTSTGSSIYCVGYGEDTFHGLQNGDPDARDLGELQSKPAMRTRVEWYPGIAIMNGRAASRYYGIKNAAWTK